MDDLGSAPPAPAAMRRLTSGFSTARLTRRDLLGRFGALAVGGVAGSSLLAACGGSSPAPAPAPAGGGAAPAASPAAPAPAAAPTAPPPAAVAVAPSPSPAASPAASQAGPGAGARPSAQRSGTFTIVDGTEPDGFDPPKHTGPFQEPMFAIYDGLVRFDASMSVAPMLATSWQPNDDASVWTFKLRNDVKFHDGSPFNAEAAKASLERIIAPNSGATRRSAYLVMKQIDAVDPTTLKITLDGPFLDFPFLLADSSALIVNAVAAAKAGDTFGRQPVGSGPYRFDNWVAGQRVEMVPNADYWGAPPRLEKIVFRPIREGAARSAVLRTGEADMVMNLPPEDLASLESRSELTIVRQVLSSQVMAEMRQTKPPFSHKAVRKAINHAVDKQAIVQSVLNGMGQPASTPGLAGLWGTVELEPYKYDPELAKRLLAEAGYPSGFECRMQYVSGRWAKDDQVAEAVQAFLSEVGVKMTILKIDASELVPMLRKHPDEMAAELPMPLRSSSFLDNHLFRLYQSQAAIEDTAQRSGYGNPEVDRLLAAQRKELNQQERLKLFADVQRVIWDDAPFLYLFNRVGAYGYNKRINGFHALPVGEVFIGEVAKTS